jgi:D-ribose pyranose/furanose isomerase RbsD
MATYLQGVTDYIPQFQPFQPDLNFYGNIMQTKQTQYDTNWKNLNKMYGQYYHADLTREGNIAKKDNYLKQIEFNLQRVSQLDLSLEQNVDQATQIFKPFYEDKGLMKDMAETKNYNSEVTYGESLKNAYDVNEKGKYWNAGLQELHYKRQEFKDASEEDAMSMSIGKYTPYVNVPEKAAKIIKDAGLSMETVSFSADNRFIIKTKNGQQLTQKLQHLLESQLGNDPGVQDVYKTQAYVDRKDYAEVNAAQFKGDKNAAEMKYLEDNFKVLKAKSDLRYKNLQNQSTVYANNIKDLETQIANKTASPSAQAMLDQLKMNKDVTDQVLTRATAEQKELNTGQSTATTSTGFINPYGDLKSLRFKVDSAKASSLMQKDLDEAAETFAYNNFKQDIDANPYAVLADKHRNTLSEIAARERASMRVADYKEKKARETKAIADGTHYVDSKGNVLPVESQFVVRSTDIKAGNATDVSNLKTKSKEISQMTKEEYLDPYFKATFSVLDAAIRSKKISNEEVGKILGYNKKNENITLDQFVKKYETYGDPWLRKHVGMKGIASIHGNMNQWIASNRESSLFVDNGVKTDLYKNYRAANGQMRNYDLYIKTDRKNRIENSKAVENHLSREGFKYTRLLNDPNGEQRTETEFYEALKKSGAKDYLGIVNHNNKVNKEFEKRYKQLAKTSVDGKDLAALSIIWGQQLKPIPKEYDYKEMVKVSEKAYSNHNIVKANPARLGALGTSGTGMASTASTITVNPKGATPSKLHFMEAMNDLQNFDFNGTKDKVTFGGIGKFNYDNAPAGRNKKGETLKEALLRDFYNPKSKLGTFELTTSSVAAGSTSKGAIIIKPTKEWVDQYRSKDEAGKGNLLTNEEANDLLTNGMSFIMDSKKMKSTMYKQSFKSPLQTYVDEFGKYEQSSIGGDPYKSYTITPNKIGTGDYITTITWGQWDPIKKETIKQTYTNNVGFQGGNLEYNMDNVLTNFFDDIDYTNTYNNNNY